MEIVIKITDSEVRQAFEEYGYEVTNQRVADVMETIATSHYVDADEIIRVAIETLADFHQKSCSQVLLRMGEVL